jgi:hypothetical protein
MTTGHGFAVLGTMAVVLIGCAQQQGSTSQIRGQIVDAIWRAVVQAASRRGPRAV